jgi:hypothetical protein
MSQENLEALGRTNVELLRPVYEEWRRGNWKPRFEVYARVIAKGRASGIELDRELGGLWEIREGLVIKEWIYLDRTEALEAAGLSE